MSGIARVMLDMGHKISGSDLVVNSLTKTLESMGATIFEGHRPSNLPKDTGVLVYSSSVSKENPELAGRAAFAELRMDSDVNAGDVGAEELVHVALDSHPL